MVFRALLNGEMREGKEGVVTIEDVKPQVFRAMLHYIYTDSLPPVRIQPPAWYEGLLIISLLGCALPLASYAILEAF